MLFQGQIPICVQCKDTQHLISHFDIKAYYCNTCGKLSTYDQIENFYTGVKPVAPQQCKYCSTASVRVAMQEHTTSWECSVCAHIEAKPNYILLCGCLNCGRKYSVWTNQYNKYQRLTQQRPTPMTPSGSIKIWWDTSVSAYRMTSPYNATLVDTLKQRIAVSERSYDPSTKIWTFTDKVFQPLMDLLKLLNISPTVITRQQAEASQTASGNTSSAPARRGQPLPEVALTFLRVIGLDNAKRAFRAAASQLHPDVNPTAGDKMTELNAAWDRLQREVYNG